MAPVSIEHWTGRNLPYVDGFANLVVLEDPGLVSSNEVWRVLAPLGKASLKEGNNWVTWMSKPWPTNIDEWTHYLHDAAGTCVANDTVAGPPRRLQWTAGPRFSRIMT